LKNTLVENEGSRRVAIGLIPQMEVPLVGTGNYLRLLVNLLATVEAVNKGTYKMKPLWIPAVVPVAVARLKLYVAP